MSLLLDTNDLFSVTLRTCLSVNFKEVNLSQLALYSQFNLREPYQVSERVDVLSKQLAEDGIYFRRLPLVATLPNDSLSEEEILAMYQSQIDTVNKDHHYKLTDVTSITESDAIAISIRDRYLSEHTHDDDEVRFFLEGSVLLYIHVNQRIHMLNCTQGDLVIIPAGVKHWLDIGPNPNFSSIRCYNTKEGLINKFTHSCIAESTPRWESIFNLHH